MIKGNIEFLDAASERECAFYTDYLLQNIRSASPKNLRGNSLVERVQKLNEELESLVNKKRVPQNFASQMRAAFNASQLEISHFRWIDKKDERLCNWLWCYLKSQTAAVYSKDQGHEKQWQQLSDKPFQTDRDNASDRYLDILDAFYNGEADNHQQQQMLEILKTQWQNIRHENALVDWLDSNNPVQWAWAWSYLQNITQRPLEQTWTPSSDDERYAAVIATLDLTESVDRKALVIDKMKKAWSQKKFREKSSGKKPYSISMSLNTKQKLNALAEENNMKINEMVEHLIRKEYNKRNSND